MKDAELVAALRKLKVNTTGLACLGCNYGLQCSTKGCRLIGLAANRIAEYDSALKNINAVYETASGAEKSILRDVIAVFDPAYGNPSNLRKNIAQEPKRNPRSDILDAPTYAFPPFQLQKRITDFELCADTEELATTLRCIDDNGYTLMHVTQDASGVYTVFFRRPARE